MAFFICLYMYIYIYIGICIYSYFVLFLRWLRVDSLGYFHGPAWNLVLFFLLGEWGEENSFPSRSGWAGSCFLGGAVRPLF